MNEFEIISRKEAKEKGLKRYFTGKPCKRGHINERFTGTTKCRACNFEDLAKNKEYHREQSKLWYEENKEYHKKLMQKWTEDNYTHHRQLTRKWATENWDYCRDYAREYTRKNKDHINKRNRENYKSNADHKMRHACRSLLRRVIVDINDKEGRTYDLLGYSNIDLRMSIENKFIDKMSWDNYGEWHIDHIYPVSRCILDGIEDPSVINALDNLIPMWASHNISKKDRNLEEFLTDRPELFNLYGHFLETSTTKDSK